MNTLIELMQKRAAAVDEMKAIVAKADEEKRDLKDEEQARFDELSSEVDTLNADIERRKKLDGLEKLVGTSNNQRNDKNQSSQGHKIDDPSIGLGDKEIKEYSLVRAIRAASTGNWKGAEYELELSNEVSKRLNREPNGFFVPYDIQRSSIEKRDMVKGTDSAGGYTVSTDLLASSFIDMLRNKMVVRAAGASILSGLVGDVAIPRQTGGATAYWVAESGAPTESEQTLDQVALSPKSVAAFTDISRKLLLQSSIDVEAFVRNDLSTVLALAIDLASLHGSGASNEPLGIAGTSGVGSVAGGTDGLAPAWSHIVNLETEVAADNADIGRLAYITNAKVRGKLKEVEKASGTAQFVWERGGSPLNGYPAHISNQVKSNLDKGTSTGVCSAIFFGNWADLIIGMWGTLDILVDPYTGGTSGTVRVIEFQDVDIAVRHAESFAVMLDALTA